MRTEAKKKKPQWFDAEEQVDVVAYINRVKSKQSKMSKENSPTKQVVGIKDKELERAGIFERFKNVSFQTISVDDDIRENAEMIYHYAKNIDKYIAEFIGVEPLLFGVFCLIVDMFFIGIKDVIVFLIKRAIKKSRERKSADVQP